VSHAISSGGRLARLSSSTRHGRRRRQGCFGAALWIKRPKYSSYSRAPTKAGSRPWYSVEVRNGEASVSGDTSVALVRGVYAWLRQAGCAYMSWEGDRVALPAQFGDFESGRVESPFAHRAYLNTCTLGYTTPWWGWSRWSREIDLMAAHGIDMPLAIEDQEYFWRSPGRPGAWSKPSLPPRRRVRSRGALGDLSCHRQC